MATGPSSQAENLQSRWHGPPFGKAQKLRPEDRVARDVELSNRTNLVQLSGKLAGGLDFPV